MMAGVTVEGHHQALAAIVGAGNVLSPAPREYLSDGTLGRGLEGPADLGLPAIWYYNSSLTKEMAVVVVVVVVGHGDDNRCYGEGIGGGAMEVVDVAMATPSLALEALGGG